MLIPKSKMPTIMRALKFVIDVAEDRFDPPLAPAMTPDEIELIKQLYDQATLVLQGDGTALQINSYYGGQ